MAPDLLLTYNWGSFDAVLAARSLGLKRHVHHEDGFNLDEAHGQLRRRALARRLALRGVPRIVVPSRRLEQLAQDTWRLTSDQVRRIVNGVDSEHFKPADASAGPSSRLREELGIPPDALVVGSVGHLRPVKRYDRLIRAVDSLHAAENLPAVHLLLVGEGAERSSLEQQIESAQTPRERFHLVGHQQDLVPWYQALDLFCLSSDSEQLPVSLLEAMACGVPVCATDVGDIRHSLPEAARQHLVPLSREDTSASLGRGLAALLSQPQERQQLADLGRQQVQSSFSEAAMVQSYRALYSEVAGV